MPLYLVPPVPASLPACAQATDGVACRCCPGGISPSTRGRVYPSDMSDAEWRSSSRCCRRRAGPWAAASAPLSRSQLSPRWVYSWSSR